MKIGPLEVEIWLSKFEGLAIMPNCMGAIKRDPGPPRSENSMPPRLKINFIPYANTPESLVLLSKIAKFRIFF